MGCSMAPEGVAILVHPEVDARALKARGEGLCAAAGAPRLLVVVGGLVAPAAARGSFGMLLRRERPLSLLVFVVLVLVALAIVPATRHRALDAATGRAAPLTGATAPRSTDQPGGPASPGRRGGGGDGFRSGPARLAPPTEPAAPAQGAPPPPAPASFRPD